MEETLLTNIDLLGRIRKEKRLSGKYDQLFSTFLRKNVSGKEKEDDEIRLVQFLTDNLAEAKDIVDKIEAVDFDIIDKIKKHFLILREVIRNSSKVIHSERLMAKLEVAEKKLEQELSAFVKGLEGNLLASIKENKVYFEYFTSERGNVRKLYRGSKRLDEAEQKLIAKGQEIKVIENSFQLRRRGQSIQITEEKFEEELEKYLSEFEDYLKDFRETELRKIYLDIEELRKVLKVLMLLDLIKDKLKDNPKFVGLWKAYEEVAEKIKKWKLIDYNKLKGLEELEPQIEADFKSAITELKQRQAYYKKLQQGYFFDSFKTRLHCTETAYLTAYSMLYHKQGNMVKAMAILSSHLALGTPSMGGRDVKDWGSLARDLGMKSKKIALRKVRSLPVGSVFQASVNLLYTVKDQSLRGALLQIFRKHEEIDALGHTIAFLKRAENEFLYIQNINEFPVEGLLGYVSKPEKIEPIQRELESLGVQVIALNNNVGVDFEFLKIMSIANDVLLMERLV